MTETHQEDEEKHHENNTDKTSEHSWRVYSFSWSFCHDSGGYSVVKFISFGSLKGEPEVNLAIGDVSSDLTVESFVTDDKLEFIISRHVLDLFLNGTLSTGSPRSTTALKVSLSPFQLARTGSVRLS